MNKVTIKLTNDQQKQIKDATGRSITELNLDLAGTGNLTEKELGQVSGGANVTIMKVLDKVSPL